MPATARLNQIPRKDARDKLAISKRINGIYRKELAQRKLFRLCFKVHFPGREVMPIRTSVLNKQL